MIRNNSLWAITDAEMKNLVEGLKVAESGIKFDDFFNVRQPLRVDENRLAHIDVKGALLNDVPKIYDKIGNTDYKTLIREIAEAKAQGAKACIFKMRSGGGSVLGLKEVAQEIEKMGIPTLAYVDSMSCSACYYLACSCDWIFSSVSAINANIGTVLVYWDETKFWESFGIHREVFTNEGADLKSTFRESLSDEQREFLQEQINELGADFKNQVSTNRPGISEEVYRAGWYSGQRCLEMGIVDQFCTYQEAVEEILGSQN